MSYWSGFHHSTRLASAILEATYQPHRKDALERKVDNIDTQDDCQIKEVWKYEESFGYVYEYAVRS